MKYISIALSSLLVLVFFACKNIEKEDLLNGEFVFKSHSHSYSLGQYGGCTAEITMLFSDLEMSVMLVD